MEKYNNLIGKSVDQARELYPGKVIRILVEDNVYSMVTTEVHPNRLNVGVEGDLITEVIREG